MKTPGSRRALCIGQASSRSRKAAQNSWLSLFIEITCLSIGCGTLRIIEASINAIIDYIATHNEKPQSFAWITEAKNVLGKVRRARAGVRPV